jgi:hypothetical protein
VDFSAIYQQKENSTNKKRREGFVQQAQREPIINIK